MYHASEQVRVRVNGSQVAFKLLYISPSYSQHHRYPQRSRRVMGTLLSKKLIQMQLGYMMMWLCVADEKRKE